MKLFLAFTIMEQIEVDTTVETERGWCHRRHLHHVAQKWASLPSHLRSCLSRTADKNPQRRFSNSSTDTIPRRSRDSAHARISTNPANSRGMITIVNSWKYQIQSRRSRILASNRLCRRFQLR